MKSLYYLMIVGSITMTSCSSEDKVPTAKEMNDELNKHTAEREYRTERLLKLLDNAHRYDNLDDSKAAEEERQKIKDLEEETEKWEAKWQKEYDEKKSSWE